MLEHYFLKPKTIDRIRASWIAGGIETYVSWLEGQGHSAQTIHRRVPLLVSFGEYSKGRGATSIEDLPKYLTDFANHCEKQSLCRSDGARKTLNREIRGCLRQMLSIVLPAYDGRARSRRAYVPRFDFLDRFFKFLKEERGLSKASLRVYDYSLGLLQSYFDRIGLANMQDLSPPVLGSFVLDIKDRLGKAALIRVLCPVRVLLRWLYRERLTGRDLSTMIEVPRTYELSALPRSISWDEVRLMLESVDRRTVVGRRDYAILLLLVTYGLRAREIATITLDDIDWKAERLRIRDRKAGHSTGYPLSSVVGDAIIDYLRKDRPKTADRHLFFRINAPIRAMSWQAVGSRALHYLRTAGIDIPKRGSHTLRHTCVQRLVDAQFSLKQIGDYVGHSSPDTTRIYAKVDFESLRELAVGLGEDLL
jgi:site-specific recombinase XerD